MMTPTFERPRVEHAPLDERHTPNGVSDRIAHGMTKALRFMADTFFSKRYGHRAVVLETVAAVPGMVGALLVHLQALCAGLSDDQRLDARAPGGGR
jgi:ubiquinol oxidase